MRNDFSVRHEAPVRREAMPSGYGWLLNVMHRRCRQRARRDRVCLEEPPFASNVEPRQ